jgi:hypothetical protein
MGKMPFADWKEWATHHSEWIHDDVGDAFEKFVEQKLRSLNMSAAEPKG